MIKGPKGCPNLVKKCKPDANATTLLESWMNPINPTVKLSRKELYQLFINFQWRKWQGDLPNLGAGASFTVSEAINVNKNGNDLNVVELLKGCPETERKDGGSNRNWILELEGNNRPRVKDLAWWPMLCLNSVVDGPTNILVFTFLSSIKGLIIVNPKGSWN